MKKINFLMALMMAFTLSFVACNEPEPAPEPDPVPPVKDTFVVEIGEVTSSSVAYTVTPLLSLHRTIRKDTHPQDPQGLQCKQ